MRNLIFSKVKKKKKRRKRKHCPRAQSIPQSLHTRTPTSDAEIVADIPAGAAGLALDAMVLDFYDAVGEGSIPGSLRSVEE